MKGRPGRPRTENPSAPLPLPLQQAFPNSGSRGPSIALTVGYLLPNTVRLLCSVLPFLLFLGSPYSSGLGRDAILKHRILKSQPDTLDPTRSREIPQNITLCPPTLSPASQGSSGKLILKFASRTVFSSAAWTSSPLSSALHPLVSGNVNTRQLPSTQHHHIALHAAVPLRSPTSPSRRPVLRPPHICIYISVPQPPSLPSETRSALDPHSRVSHLRTPGRAHLLLPPPLPSQAISMGLGQLWSFQPPDSKIPFGGRPTAPGWDLSILRVPFLRPPLTHIDGHSKGKGPFGPKGEISDFSNSLAPRLPPISHPGRPGIYSSSNLLPSHLLRLPSSTSPPHHPRNHYLILISASPTIKDAQLNFPDNHHSANNQGAFAILSQLHPRYQDQARQAFQNFQLQ